MSLVITEVKASYTMVYYVCPACKTQVQEELSLASVVGTTGMNCCSLIFPTNCPDCNARLDVELLSSESIV